MTLRERPARRVDGPVTSPPRRVPWSVRLRVLFESTAGGWILLGVVFLASAEHLRKVISEPAAIVAGVFPLVGAVVVASTLWTRVRWIRLLAHGRETPGTLVDIRWTTIEVNGRGYAVLTFSILTEDGRPHQVELGTLEPERVQSPRVQPIFHDRARPRRAVAWRQLPPSVSFDERGELRPAELLGTLVWLLPPAVAVLLGVIGYAHR